MALVNPNIAMSFRQPEFRPRNALAEYAQVQQIVGGQRQAEMADMQLESLRRERDALGQIQAAIVAKGGPPDLEAAADAMIRTGRPEYLTQGMAIRTALRNQREAEAYRRDFGGGAAAPSAAAAEATGAAAAPGATPTFPIAGKDVRMGTLGTGTFDSARISDIGLAQPGLSRMSAAEKAELAASAGPGGIQSMRMPQGPYTGTESMIADILRAPPEEQAAIERALPSMKIPGVSAGRVPPFSQLSRDLLSPETRNALDYNYAPSSLAAPAGSVNALAAPPANVNQLASAAAVPAAAAQPARAAAAAPDANAARLRALEAQYRRIGNNPELASEKALVLKQIEDVQATIRAENATPPEAKFMRSLGLPLTREGFAEFEALKQRPGEFERLLSQSGLSKADQTALIQQRLRKEVTHAPGTTVNVSTEKKYGERFGGLIADRDAGKLDAAEGAPRVIENADRITDILASGKVFTGTGANVRLQIAKALNLAGGTDTERIANTEVLISSLANSTLGAIKSSNLGAGQGFTNADRDFLEKAASGQITYDAVSLRRLAELGRKVGVASIESWNNRVRQMPRSALEGAGISADPLPIPGRRPASATTIPQEAIDMLKRGAGTREQFDAQFGPGSADRVLPRGR